MCWKWNSVIFTSNQCKLMNLVIRYMHKAITVLRAEIDTIFTKSDGTVVTTYKVKVLIRSTFFVVDFYTERQIGKVVSFYCNKALLELYGVCIAYFGKALTRQQGRNAKHNAFTANLSESIAKYLEIEGDNNDSLT